jgi:ribosomal protein S18 acetylase RimI-like enzyme/predicted kinase
MINPFVIVISGPTGVGKTTLAKILRQHLNCIHISEDEIAKKIFPNDAYTIDDCPDKLIIVDNLLLERTKEIFTKGECVVVDRVNMGKEFIDEIRRVFHEHLLIKVLWPPKETAIERDKKREGWTSGENIIRHFYKKYEELKSIIGEKNYIDNSHQTPEETFEKFFARIKFEIHSKGISDEEWVRNLIIKHWGSTKIVSKGKVTIVNSASGFVVSLNSEPVGLITYLIENDDIEIITLNSEKEGIGIGTALINAVINTATKQKCKRVWVITTNDNLPAINFYKKRGFSLKTIYKNAIEESRKIKPEIPILGIGGIPIKDELEFEMMLN